MPPIWPAMRSPRSESRSNTATLAPRRASSRAVASPRPDAAPVTTAATPLMSISSPDPNSGGGLCAQRRLRQDRRGRSLERAILWSAGDASLREVRMEYKRLGTGLGYFSLALGLVELAAPGRIARWLGIESKPAKSVIALFGARELLAAGMLLRGPAVSTNVWNRVIGDGIDLAALGLAFTRSDRKTAVAGAVGFVAGAT